MQRASGRPNPPTSLPSARRSRLNIPNPYLEKRELSQGELAQEYAALFNMAALFFGLQFTDREKYAFSICIGAVLRERHKVDLVKVIETLKGFIPK